MSGMGSRLRIRSDQKIPRPRRRAAGHPRSYGFGLLRLRVERGRVGPSFPFDKSRAGSGAAGISTIPIRAIFPGRIIIPGPMATIRKSGPRGCLIRCCAIPTHPKDFCAIFPAIPMKARWADRPKSHGPGHRHRPQQGERHGLQHCRRLRAFGRGGTGDRPIHLPPSRRQQLGRRHGYPSFIESSQVGVARVAGGATVGRALYPQSGGLARRARHSEVRAVVLLDPLVDLARHAP